MKTKTVRGRGNNRPANPKVQPHRNASPVETVAPTDWEALLGAKLFAAVMEIVDSSSLSNDGEGMTIQQAIVEAIQNSNPEECLALAAGRPGALAALMKLWASSDAPDEPVQAQTAPPATASAKARLAFDDIARIVLDIKRAQMFARGLLASLSSGLAGATEVDQVAIGIKASAGNLAEHVAMHWKDLGEAWGRAREERESAEARRQLESCLTDMVAPMRAAAACVHMLALALKEHSAIGGTFHAEGVTEGYEDLAVFWAGEILLPVDQWARPVAYFGEVAA